MFCHSSRKEQRQERVRNGKGEVVRAHTPRHNLPPRYAHAHPVRHGDAAGVAALYPMEQSPAE
jgi:hypothetical protein